MSGPLRAKQVSHEAETIYVGEFIDLKRVQENIRHYSYLNRDHPLVVKILDNQYAVLTKFGSVTFWNLSSKFRKEFLDEIKPFVKNKKDTYPYDENTGVVEGSREIKITFDKVFLPQLKVDQIKIISYVLSQSVALERYEAEIGISLSEIGTIVENMKSSGKPLLSERQLLRQIGKVLSVKQITVTHLSLFDKPDEIWESPDLEEIYNRMHKEYELQDRFDVLGEKIKYLSDVSQMFMNLSAEKRSEFLEKIIIWLFIVDLTLWFLPPFPEIWEKFTGLLAR